MASLHSQGMKMSIDTVFTPNAPKPAGHYSQAVIHNGIVYISGQLPVNPAHGVSAPGSIEEQTRQVLENLNAILAEAGSSRENVLRTTVYISDVALWAAVNAIYSEFFGDHRPARTVVPTGDLHYGFSIELDAIAVVKA